MATEVDRRWGRGWRRPRPKERKKAIFDPIHKRPFFVGPAAVRLPGVRTKVRHLGFAWPRSCAAPLLRGPGGLRSSAPQLCGSWIRVNFQCCCFFPSDDIAPRLRVPPPGAQNANPYNVFGPRGRILAIPTTFSGPWGGIFVTPTTFSGPGGAFMRPLQRVRPRGGGLF